VAGVGVELERFPELDLCEALLTLGLELFMLYYLEFHYFRVKASR